MRFTDFITKQRGVIFVIGLAAFVVSLIIAHTTGFTTLWGALFVDLAASAITVIFTALIIDYLGVREESNRTKNAASLAEDEIKATCFRLEFRMARLFGLERPQFDRNQISSRQQASTYLETMQKEVDDYLTTHSMTKPETPLEAGLLPRYLERLEAARTELEQALMLYEYAISYSLRERVLNLRSELQIADNMIGFIDASEELNDANSSLIRVLSESVYNEIKAVLEHDSRATLGVPIHAKNSRLA